MDLKQLIKRHKIISDQISADELHVILLNLEKIMISNIPGAIVEMGCYVGTTSLFIQRLLRGANREFHVYDSFEGLPEKTDKDYSAAGEQFRAGELLATKQQFIKYFKQAGLPLPVIHKGWFNQLTDAEVPSAIAFAFLDGDYYESIRDSLIRIQDKLSPGAIIIVDDYASEALPGARRATDAWLKNKDYACLHTHSLAVIQLPLL